MRCTLETCKGQTQAQRTNDDDWVSKGCDEQKGSSAKYGRGALGSLSGCDPDGVGHSIDSSGGAEDLRRRQGLHQRSRALTCAQLAGTFQEDADFLGVWYSGWLNGNAKKHMINVRRTKEGIHNVIVYCKANPEKKVIEAVQAVLSGS